MVNIWPEVSPIKKAYKKTAIKLFKGITYNLVIFGIVLINN
jgi:hypothetical protein